MLYMKANRNSWFEDFFERDINKKVLIYDSDDLSVQKVSIGDVYSAMKAGIKIKDCELRVYGSTWFIEKRGYSSYEALETNDLLFLKNTVNSRITSIDIIYKNRLFVYRLTNRSGIIINDSFMGSNCDKRSSNINFVAKYGDEHLLIDCGICYAINVFDGRVYRLSRSRTGLGISGDIESHLNSSKDYVGCCDVRYTTIQRYKVNKLLGGNQDYSDRSKIDKYTRNESADIAAYMRERYSK